MKKISKEVSLYFSALGGKTSGRKKIAARKNGLLGGRPRKIK